MFGRDTRTTRRRSRGAALLLIALLPGWVLPPSCAACPHGAAEAGAAAAVVHDGAHQGEHHGELHGAHEAAGESGHHGAHLDRESLAGHDHEAPDESHDCGCPCDVQCVAPGLSSAGGAEVAPSMDGDAPTRIVVATALRPEAPRFPPFFLPLSTAPPR